MSGGRTELPTPRRLRDARRRGEVARSRELTGGVALAAGLAAIAALGPWAVGELSGALRATLLSAATSSTPPLAQLGDALQRMARILSPFVLLPAAAAGATGALQSGFLFSFEPLRFRLDRLDPAQGVRRLLSAGGAAQLALGLAKGAAACALLGGWLAGSARSLGQLPGLSVGGLWRAMPLGPLALRLGLAALAFGALDLALARRRHRRTLMMTRDEVRRESKEDEGDPQHRAERRRLHRALLEAGPVSKATVVVVNPTHVAVALLHRRGRDEAPRVLAKGTGAGAARIRSAARRAGVPIVRDVALSRALFRLAEVGEEIPAELFEAAAAVLVHVYGLGEERA